MNEWVRIPFPIDAEEDRRSLCAILVSAGLSVRVVKARYGTSKNPPLKKFVEYSWEWRRRGIRPALKNQILVKEIINKDAKMAATTLKKIFIM